MFPLHRIFDLRMCGAITQNLPNLNQKVLAEGILAAVVGQLDSHTNLGPLIKAGSPKVMIQGVPAIAAIRDLAGPDMIASITHMQGLPIPAKGSSKVFMGDGSGFGGMGLGMLNGNFSIGEMLSIGQQIIGQVSGFANLGGGGGAMQISGLQGNPPQTGQTVTGQTSGATMNFVAYIDSRHAYPPTADTYAYPAASSVTDAILTDSGDYIVIDSFYDYPSQNLTVSLVTV